MSHLRSIALRSMPDAQASQFPFSVPVIRTLSTLETDAAVTFLVGENGSGKSTLLEGIAAAAGLPAVGSESVDRDATLSSQRALGHALKLVWTHRTRRGFFLRAEDFFGFAKALSKLRAELLARVDELEDEYRERSAYAKGLAQGPLRGRRGVGQRPTCSALLNPGGCLRPGGPEQQRIWLRFLGETS